MSKRPESAETDDVRLCIVDQEGKVSAFNIRRDVPMKKLLVAYSKRKKTDYRSIQFLLDGSRFRTKQTARQLNLKDGDQIDAMIHQMGGGGY